MADTSSISWVGYVGELFAQVIGSAWLGAGIDDRSQTIKYDRDQARLRRGTALSHDHGT
jgi:hypothetical protein